MNCTSNLTTGGLKFKSFLVLKEFYIKKINPKISVKQKTRYHSHVTDVRLCLLLDFFFKDEEINIHI